MDHQLKPAKPNERFFELPFEQIGSAAAGAAR
jgi:hypothetical protein